MKHTRGAGPLAGILAAGLFASMALAAAVARPVSAAADGIFGPPSATARYGRGVTFEQPFFPTEASSRVEVLLSTPGAFGPLVVEVDPPACCGVTTLRYSLDEADGHLVPNTRFTARWRATSTSGRVTLGEAVSVTYADTRFEWQTKVGSIVRVHWYDGSDAFGARALAIGEKAIEDAAKLLGVTEGEPVDFFIYADQDAFYEALGPGTRENVGGEAHADIRTMFALITPQEIDASWVAVVVPHELTHLVFDTAVKNAYHFPPRWLNEGLAVYLSEGYTDSWRGAVSEAVAGSAIIPLDGLVGQFPTTRDRFFLAYGESVSAVDFLVRRYGQAALVKLVRSYADGVSDDEAFSAALGGDVAVFQAAWLEDLGTRPPTAYGPQVAPPGPLPQGWSAAPGSSPAAVAGPSGSEAPAAPGGSAGSRGEVPVGLLVGAALGAGALGGALLWTRARRRRRGGPPADRGSMGGNLPGTAG